MPLGQFQILVDWDTFRSARWPLNYRIFYLEDYHGQHFRVTEAFLCKYLYYYYSISLKDKANGQFGRSKLSRSLIFIFCITKTLRKNENLCYIQYNTFDVNNFNV